MTRRNEAWQLRRSIVRAATRKTNALGIGMRRPLPGETPLSPDEISFGAARGIVKLPPLPWRRPHA